MRAADGPLAMFLEGARRLARDPLAFAALWLPALIATYTSGATLSLPYIEGWTEFVGDWRADTVIALGLVLSTFLTGGVLSRYAHPHATGTARFFADCRAYAGRILRLTVLSAVIIEVFHRYLHPALATIHFETAVVATFAAQFFVMMCIQLAVARMVVEDRRSILFALLAGWRLLAARPVTVLALYGLIALALNISMILPFYVLGGLWWDAGVLPVWLADLLLTAMILSFDLLAFASSTALYQAEMVRRRPGHDPAVASSGLSGLNALTAKE
jgi:hypothetical protein